MRRFFLRLRAVWLAVRGAWRDPEVTLHTISGAVPLDYNRFRVVRFDADGREVVANRGGSPTEARQAYERSMLLPGVTRVELWDGNECRGLWNAQ